MLRNAHVRYTRAHYSVVCVCVCVGVGVGLLAAVAVAGAQRRALLVRWHLGLVVVFVTCHAGGGKGVLAFCVARRGRHGARRACARFASYKGQGRGDGARSRRSRSVIALRIAPVAGASGTAASLTASSSCCCPSAIASQAQRSVDRVCAGGVADREGVLRAGGKRSPARAIMPGSFPTLVSAHFPRVSDWRPIGPLFASSLASFSGFASSSFFCILFAGTDRPPVDLIA